MKFYFFSFLILTFIVVICLGSWVDPNTVDIWQGRIAYVNSSYDVTKLSGDIEFYLDSYDGLCLTDSGYLFNISNSVINGYAKIGSNEYDIRFSSLCELQIYQSYTRSGYTYNTWVDYHLIPENGLIPGSGIDSSSFIVLILIVILVVLTLRLFL